MIAKEAKYYELGIILGLISKDEVIAWADKLIEELDEPPSNILDISLCGKKNINEIAALLNRFEKGNKYQEISTFAFRKIGSLLKQKIDMQKLTYDEVAQRLYLVSQQIDLYLTEEYERFCSWVDDEFSLVNQGIKDRSNAEKDLYSFLLQLIETKEV